MKKIILSTLAAIAVLGAVSATPAEARCFWNGYGWNCYHRHHHGYWRDGYWRDHYGHRSWDRGWDRGW